MADQYPRCVLHQDNPCPCHLAFAQLQQISADIPIAAPPVRYEQGSTSSQSQLSPRDTSSSGTYPNTEAATGSVTPAKGSAFSPLAPCFDIVETGDQARGLDLPVAMQSGSQNRHQLLQRFYDLHLGASSHARAIFQYEAIGSGTIGRLTTTSAMDALCVAQIATTFGDAQLMVESRRMYRSTMQLLGARIRAVGESTTPRPDHLDDIIGAIHALTATSWFRCVGAGALDWTRHAQALLRVLKVSSNPPVRAGVIIANR